MSRPSDAVHANCGINPGYNYVVIGNTAAAVIETIRLYEAGSPLIGFMAEGSNHAGDPNVRAADFNMGTAKSILSYLIHAKVRRIFCNGLNKVHNYFHGSGMEGNFIAAYYIPRVGPWFSGQASPWVDFIQCNTLSRRNTIAEDIVVGRLSTMYNLQITNNIAVEGPSIMGSVRSFVRECGSGVKRNLFDGHLAAVANRPEIHNICGPCGLSITKTGQDYNGNIYDVEATNFAVSNARISWKIHPFQFLKLKETTGACDCCLDIPAFYRAILSVPMDSTRTGGTNLSGPPVDPDFISSYISFSIGKTDCHGGRSPWRYAAYTTQEDLSQVSQNGVYAQEGSTLLIVEAVCNTNLRTAQYNSQNRSIDINLNDELTEVNTLETFASVVGGIFTSYTGLPITVAQITTPGNACYNGVCTLVSPSMEGSERESPLEMVIHMASMLYGNQATGNSFPTLS